MKNNCQSCNYSKVYNEDKEYNSVLEMINDVDNNFLICTHSNNRICARVEDDFVCELYKENKGFARDIKMMGGFIK